MHSLKYFLLPIALAVTFNTVGCSSSDDDAQPSAYSLKILHINDHHSHVQPESAKLTLDGVATDVETGGFARVKAKIAALEATNQNVLKLHGGDAITGTLFYTLFEGEVDAELMNDVCFDALVVGNHEFDASDAGLKTFLDYLDEGTCNMPVLGANVVPEVGTPLAPNTETDYIKPYAIKEIGGEQIGIIGIEIGQKTKNSSNPLESTQFLDETTTSQKYIDELTSQGINKIVLLTHNQYDRDITMAASLSGVDVIVDGDSHTLLGEGFTELGLSPEGPYPTVVENKDGNQVCVAQAWQYSSIVGELNVGFDEDGVVESCGGIPHLMLGGQFKQDDAEGNTVLLEGAEKQAVLDFIDNTPELSVVTPDLSSLAIVDKYSEQVDVLKTTVIGTASEDLCFERIPGQGRSEIAGCSESTNARGSDISNIVALAFREQSIEADFSIQNGGGVRIDIPAGEISVGDAYTLLPFANTLYNLDMTGAEIRQVLEEAVTFSMAKDGSTGAYPYASGLRWNVDLSQPEGARIINLQAKLKGEIEWSSIDTERLYKVVTNSFTAGGKDGYITFGTIEDSRRLDTYLDYAQSFVDYVKRVGVVSKLSESDYSTQTFVDSEGVLQR